MTGEILKAFMVGLGFDVDDASLSKFNKAVTSASVRIVALYASIKATAAGVFWSISKISEGFEQMGYEYRIIAPAINKAIVLRNELLKAYRAAGINLRQVVVESIKFNMSLAKTKFAFEAIYKSVGSRFLPMLTKQMDIFRGKLYASMPRIQSMLEKFIKFIFKAFEATVILGTRVWSILQRVYDFFYQLHKATDGWSTVIIGVIAAWKLLNLAFLATPLGMLLTGLLAILALYDDFMTFKEGGKSLFDWTPMLPAIEAVKKLMGSVFDVLMGLGKVAKDVWDIFSKLFKTDWSGAFDSLIAAGKDLLKVFGEVWEVFKGLVGVAATVGATVGERLKSLFGGNDQNQVGSQMSNVQPLVRPAPLGTNISNQKQTNVNVSQQTQINVTGAADANSTGRSVAEQQTRVNFDLTRNMKGAVR